MPTQFKDYWLIKKDTNGTIVKEWARKVKDNKFRCFCWICNKDFKGDKGFCRLEQHSATTIHRLSLPKIKSQLTLTSKKNIENVNSSNAKQKSSISENI